MLAHLRAVPWRLDQDAFKAWRQGLTGYPLVDAGAEINPSGKYAPPANCPPGMCVGLRWPPLHCLSFAGPFASCCSFHGEMCEVSCKLLWFSWRNV
jgi:hypothetical protein